MIRIALFLILVTLQSTSLLGQLFVGDSLSCYSKGELYKIVVLLEQGSECDTLLKLTQAQSLNKDTIIRNDSIQNKARDEVLAIKDTLINNRDSTIKYKDLVIKSGSSQVKTTKLELIGVTLAFILYIIFHK